MSVTTAERRRMMESTVMSMNPAEQIELVMDHALLHLQAVRDLGPDSPWERQRPHLMQAQKAVSLLLESLLRPDAEGAEPEAVKMAGDFRALYLFVINQIIAADLKRTPPPVEGLMRVLGNLADGWKKGVLGRG